MTDATIQKVQTSAKPQRDRSPAYPFISLKAAFDRVVAFDAKFGRHGSPMNKAGIAWGYKGDSSQASQTLSALKYFGLLEYTGPTNDRMVMLTEDARNYMRAQQTSVKAEIAKACALRPKAMQTYWSRWGADRPIDEVALDQLILKDSFTEAAAKVFLRVYDETVAFSNLGVGDKVGATDLGDDESDFVTPPPPTKPKVGDFVRWESEGVVQFDARRVQGISGDGEYLFVEGSQTGLPVKETSVVPTPFNPPASDPPPNPHAQSEKKIDVSTIQPPAGMKGDVFSFPGSDAHAVFQWPTTMTQDELQDLEDWLEIKIRGIKRTIQ